MSKPRPVRKGQGRNAGMNASEGSDCAILPVNRPNKEDVHSAEVGEGRARTKENIVWTHTIRTQSRSDSCHRD